MLGKLTAVNIQVVLDKIVAGSFYIMQNISSDHVSNQNSLIIWDEAY